MSTASEEQVERVARAIWDLNEDTDCHDYDRLSAPAKKRAEEWARAAIAAMGEQWRDISSAPKDGSRIWLADAKSVVTGRWHVPVGAWQCDWVVGSAGDRVTHWMPLPAPPVTA